jgi:hypothetical protein
MPDITRRPQQHSISVRRKLSWEPRYWEIGRMPLLGPALLTKLYLIIFRKSLGNLRPFSR